MNAMATPKFSVVMPLYNEGADITGKRTLFPRRSLAAIQPFLRSVAV